MKKVGLISEFPCGFSWRTLKNQKNLLGNSSFYTGVPKTTIIWDTVPEIRSETIFFVILDHFLPFMPPAPNSSENKFENFKKASGDAIILNLWNKKHDQMMHAYSDMKCNRHFFCHFRPFFALLPHYWPQKFNLEKM